jgi:hypothetical protein
MKFADLASGSSVFLDANVFIYAFAPDPQFGRSCTELLERIENHDLVGFTSPHVLSDVAHRLMSLEACVAFGWPYAGIAQRLNRHPSGYRSWFVSVKPSKQSSPSEFSRYPPGLVMSSQPRPSANSMDFSATMHWSSP